MSSVRSRQRSGRLRALVGVALGASLVLGGLGWLAGSAARVAMLRREVASAVSAADWARAERALARLTWYRPDDLEAIRLRVDVALDRGDRETAVSALASVPDSAPEAASAHLRRGQILKELYRAREAEDAFRAAIRLDPRLPEPRRELIGVLGIERRGAEQEAELWALHDRSGRAIEALRLLAQSSVTIPPGTLAKTSDEGAVLERCLDADPDDPHVRPPLARFLRLRGESLAARRLLEPWLARHPDDVPARVEWLGCLLDEGDFDGVSTWFESPGELCRGSADYWRLRGDWSGLKGRWDEAVVSYREAVRLAPRDPEARYRLAQGLRASGQAKQVNEVLEYHQKLQDLATQAAAIPENAPAPPERLNEIGRLCRSLGRDREARAWFAQTLRVDPNNAEARAALNRPTGGGS